MAKKIPAKKKSTSKKTGYKKVPAQIHNDGVKVHGFFRINIVEERDKHGNLYKTAKVVGDSGWKKNTVVNLGFQNYLVNWILGNTAAGVSVTNMALGTGTAPAVTDTTLNGELFHKSTNATTNSRASVSTSVVSSKTAQFTAAFNSANSFVTASANISNIGLFNTFLTSLANAGSIFAGNTYASSSVATNQSVNATYQIRFS